MFQNQLNIDTYIRDYNEFQALKAVQQFYQKHSGNQLSVYLLVSKNQTESSQGDDKQFDIVVEDLINESSYDQLKPIMKMKNYDEYKAIFDSSKVNIASTLNEERYTEYIPNPEVALQKLQVLSGVIKTSQRGKTAYIVSLHGLMVKCPTRLCINRAIDRDQVVFRIFKPDVTLEQIQQCTSLNEQLLFPQQDGMYQNVKELLRTEENDKVYYAYIVGVLQRAENIFCGTLKQPFSFKLTDDQKLQIDIQQQETINYSVFVPINFSLPQFLIKSTQDMRRFIGHRLSCQFLEWSANSMLGTVVLKEDIGSIGSLDVEARAICIDHGIDDSVLDEKKQLVSELPSQILNDEGNPDRLDLTKINICSIDPPGCKDIDDAVHCIFLEDSRYNMLWKKKQGIFPGLEQRQSEKELDELVTELQKSEQLYEVGVHIADVTHYVQECSNIDKMAQKRGTTVYLPDRRIDLLPKLLTEDVCSLVDKGPRYTFSFLCLIDMKGVVYKYQFSKCKIKNIANLTYYEAWSLINDAEVQEGKIRPQYNQTELINKLKAGLKPLFMITKELRRKRYENGALTLESPELDFTLDSNNNPISVDEHHKVPTMELIEELMLLCNVYSAARVQEAYRTTAVLRRHEKPAEHSFTVLKEQLAKNGVVLDSTNTKTIRKSLDSAPEHKNTAYKLLIRCMKLAKYVAAGTYSYEDLQHYGLALDIYTHFTSPIRRYADQLVHRQLYAAMTGKPLPDYLMGQDTVEKICQTLNTRKEEADRASRDADKFFVTLLLIRNLLTTQNTMTYEAIVQEIFDKQVSVSLLSLGIETTIPKEKDDYGANKETFRYRGKEYKVLDTIQLQITFDAEHPWDFRAKINQ